MLRRAVHALAGLCLAAAAGAAAAQTFPIPGKPIRIVVPFTPGGQTDVQARQIGQRLSASLGVPVVVDNKPGASTIIGTMEVVKAPADGHTLLYTIAITATQNPHLFSKLPYDVNRDLTPIMFVARSGMILVAPATAPFSTVEQMLEHARKNPGKLNYGSTSMGGISHLNGELLQRSAGIDIVHVPFKGTSEATAALYSGSIQLLFDGPATAIASAKSGKVKMLAIADERRTPAAPDLPTMKEAGVAGVDIPGGMQFFAPGGMPPALAERVNAALAAVIRQPDISRMLAESGNEPVISSAREHATVVQEQSRKWGALIQKMGLKLD
jgi:tripartite-type tricarboxylate transporter receptor subunit TctC